MAVRWGPWRCEGCGKWFMSNGLCQHLRCRECHPECGRMRKGWRGARRNARAVRASQSLIVAIRGYASQGS